MKASTILAKAVLRAQAIHENELATQLQKPHNLRYVFNPTYQTLQKAAQLACAELNVPELERPVYLLLCGAWNDIQDWAEAHK